MLEPFHPAHGNDQPVKWKPVNDEAKLLLDISHAWNDLVFLMRMRKSTNDDYEKKVLFRYCLIELKSVLDLFEALQSMIMQKPVYAEGEERRRAGLSEQEREKAEDLFKEYHRARNECDEKLSTVRGAIAAHRDTDSWRHAIKLWGKLEPINFSELFETIPPLFEHIKKLDLYAWSFEFGDEHLDELLRWARENSSPDELT